MNDKADITGAPNDRRNFILNRLADEVYSDNKAKGFWDKERNVGEMLMLITSELSEGLEGHRKNLMDDHLPHRSSLEVELADAMIRILDMAGGLQLDLGGAVAEKLAYNRNRPHKHGKNY